MIETEDSADRPVRLLYTGGTIGCSGAPFRPMPGAAFQALCAREGLGRDCRWAWTETALDSAEIGPADWAVLAAIVLEDEAPMVLLHGTDTMAWTAAALSYLTALFGAEGVPVGRRAAPVVLTGSQRPAFPDGTTLDPGSDGPGNMRAALMEAAAPHPGVRIAFGGKTVPGARAAKLASLADAAFDAPNGEGALPPLPPAETSALRRQLTDLTRHLGRQAVLCLPVTPGGGEALADTMHRTIDTGGIGAVHLLAFGLGTVPAEAALGPALDHAAEAGVLVALGTQLPFGPVDPARYGAGAWTLEHQAVPTGDMTVPATQAKLHLTLALAACHGWGVDRMRRFLHTPIAGEISESL